MWSSSNMFLKKLITNLCFPARSSNSTTTTAKKHPAGPVNPAAAFNTHLSRHFSTLTCRELDEDDRPPDSTIGQDEKQAKKKEMMIENMNTSSLYASTSKSTTPDDDDVDEDVFFTSSSNSDELINSDNLNSNQPDFATAFASRRFFFSSPGHSKSLMGQSSTPPPEEDGSGPLLVSAGGVPVPKYSPDPYWDFRKSMQEMVEARVEQSKLDPAQNWEYLHQLLTCYLSLNPTSTHECIIKAFSDLLVNILLDNKSENKRSASSRRPALL